MENGICVANPPSSSGYHYAPFLTINDASDILDTQDRPDLRLSKFSVAAWFRTTSVPDGTRIMDSLQIKVDPEQTLLERIKTMDYG